MINQTNVFDLKDILMNELIGDVWLFIIIGLIIVAYVSIKVKLPYQLVMLFCIFWIAVMFEGTHILMLWVFLILLVTVLFYYAISKAISRGG